MNLKLANRIDLELGSNFGNDRVGSDRPLILAADDNVDNLLLLIYALEVFGFSQISTLEGEMVLRLAQQYRPNLILLDVILPDMSGIEVIHQLKRNSLTSAIPIIAVTALARTEDREHLLAIGCDDYLDEHYDLNELETMLHRHLSQAPSF